MASRHTLHVRLVEILGSNNVYFQPPESIKLKYPCIIYHMSGVDSVNADDTRYISNKVYELTLIHEDCDNAIWEKIIELPLCELTNIFASGGLYHYNFTIYY